MKTAVDTNILFDVLLDDPSFAQTSITALEQAIREGAVVICDIFFAELVAYFDNAETIVPLLGGIRDSAGIIGHSGNGSGGSSLKLYKKTQPRLRCPRCGAHIRVDCPSCGSVLQVRQHVIPDFLVGAHAVCQSTRLLTRDRGFYRQYFTQLKVWDTVDKG